ncbi:TonB-dependent receptor plug domain-containing protein [Flagellimonas nanhaiensis]|uniref:TonB-dependent receptor plug domain-containing protein n=1 Tax=Flagellimonas nanhaiensis TaxID=2292706 RepID=A0A371JV98_9FLAO|nr:TonB-dependent receptor plug domain-containing protein [Allomuricauda nanhaiensis]RDY61739.1 hypothetical protein DX873_06210 [Allomuricauda nanhaiensis]
MKRYTLSIFLLLAGIVFSQEKKEITICWDVSLSMMDRDLDKEFYFLDAYFKTVQNADVALLTFSDQVLSKDDFLVDDGNWSSIKQKLEGLSHDGATSFDALGNYVGEGEVLMFTDGLQNMGTGVPNFSGELYVVNSKKDFDRATLNLLTIMNNGNLVNLLEEKDRNFSNTVVNEYSGRIYSGTEGLANAQIYLKGMDENATKSSSDGNFSIQGATGDTLVVLFGSRKKEVALGENLSLNLSFADSGIALDEVVLEGEKGIEKVETVTTAYGEENKDKIGYAVQSITEEDIADVSTTANNAVQGKFSGMRLGQNDDLSQVTMRPSNSILGNNYGLIVIDGVPMSRTKSASSVSDQIPDGQIGMPITVVNNAQFIDPKNIAKITVLKGLAATNRFGSLGANGVLLITTKTATVDGPKGEKPDLARLKNNIYDGKVKVNAKTLVTPYLRELKNGKNLQETYGIYLDQRKSYNDTPEYLLDLFEFFYNSSPEIANRIISNILEKEDASYEELRGMYLKCSEKGNHELAFLAANRIAEKFPDKIQSYLDLAMAHKNKGNYQQALDILNSMLEGTANPSLNLNGLEKIVGTEIRNLINSHKAQLNISKVAPKYHNNLTYDARLVLEWNNPDADFTVQFVNPQKRFFNWEHTDFGDRKRILDELKQGYSSEQFEIFGAETKGNWLLNVSYKGNRTSGNQMPTFLKCTVQRNFGRLNQTEEEFIIRLHDVNEDQQLAKFTVQ